MKSTWIRIVAFACLATMMALPQNAEARRRSRSQTFEPNVRIGQWRVDLEEREVKTITVEVQRVRGSNRTFMNARFGREGQTFEGGRRVYLRHTDWETVTWQVNQSPNGRPLIFNAYDGEIMLRKVTVQY